MTENPLYGALAKAQAEFGPIEKDRINPHFKNHYATMASLISATRPALAKHGLAVVQTFGQVDGGLVLTTVLMHESGVNIASVVPLLALNKGPQPFGSEVTYMRRYSYAALLNIVADEDDDGNEAQKAPPAAQKAPPARKPPEPVNTAPKPKETPEDRGRQLIASIEASDTVNECEALSERCGKAINYLSSLGLQEMADEIADTFLRRKQALKDADMGAAHEPIPDDEGIPA